MPRELTDEQRTEIIELIYTRQKIQAIKEYRNATGSSLVDAKNFIDQLTDALEKENPGGFRTVNTAGCGASAILFLLLPAAAIWRLFS
ncbi:MAG TPA: ribosomal protein L7/L12 [Planctomicrobium sp.]|nr:ribosomal protein L7/L12 [Planctomicrobium sp.]